MHLLKLRKVFSLNRLYIVYTLFVISAVSVSSLIGVFERPNLFFLDRAFQWRGEREPREEIAIVAISQKDFELGAPRWPWPRSLMARLIDQVSSHGPAVIAVDILYTERSNTESVFTRDQFQQIGRDAGYQETLVLPMQEPAHQFQEHTRVVLEDYCNLPPDDWPDWAAGIVRRFDDLIPDNLKAGLLIEGCTIFRM